MPLNKKIIYILGTGGMARETYSFYKKIEQKRQVLGFIVEKNYLNKKKLYGLPVFGSDYLDKINRNTLLIAGIGSALKKKWIIELEKKGYKFDQLVHTSTVIDKSLNLGTGCIVAPGTIITTDVSIGKHSIINLSVTINHDSHIGAYSHIAPGVHIAGNVKIGESVWIGIGSTIKNNVMIGNNCFIGAGSVVVKDIPNNTLAYGIPAKPVRKISDNDWENLLK